MKSTVRHSERSEESLHSMSTYLIAKRRCFAALNMTQGGAVAIIAAFLNIAVLLAHAETAREEVINAFHADLAAKVKAADINYDTAILGKDGWMFFVPEVRSVSVGRFWGEDAKKVSQAIDPQYADPLPAILDFKKQLDKVGIKLLLVPVPPKTIVFSDMISDKAPGWDGATPYARLDAAHREFYKLLRDNGVNVLDLTDKFMFEGFRQREIYVESGDLIGYSPIYCKQDTHWSGFAISWAASAIMDIIRGVLPVKRNTKYASLWKWVTIKGDLWDSLPTGANRPPQESVSLEFIGMRDPKHKDALIPIPTDKNSPVILLGDSHTLVFHEGGDMHTKGAGLADQLAYELGFPVDLIGVRGSGATPARVNLMRRARADGNYLKKKKWVVWCFSAREFTESAGWQKVPIGR